LVAWALKSCVATNDRSAIAGDLENLGVPAILPELFSRVMLTLGLAWSAVIAGEYVGIDKGLGRILTFAQSMSQTGRSALVGLLLLAYASMSYFSFARLSRRMLAWMPGMDA
jgi:ABC-type nitrate/sulfonate/bicarbonate transport system permease component